MTSLERIIACSTKRYDVTRKHMLLSLTANNSQAIAALMTKARKFEALNGKQVLKSNEIFTILMLKLLSV